MIPDAECVKIVSEILTDLKLGDFTIKVTPLETFKIIILHFTCTENLNCSVVLLKYSEHKIENLL